MKTRLLIIIAIVIGIIISGTFAYFSYQKSLCESSSGYLHDPQMNDIWDCLQFMSESESFHFSLESIQKLENARDTLSENQDIIPWTGLSVSTSEKAVTISIDSENPEDYRKIIEELVGQDIPIIIKKGGDPFIDSEYGTSSYMNEIIPTLDDFKKFSSDSPDIDTILYRFGEPHDDIGSGIHIYVYELNDDTLVWIGYTDHILYVRHVDAYGNILESLFELK